MPIKPTWPQVEPSWAKLGQVEQEDEQETTSRLTPRWQPFTTAVTSVQKRDDCLTHNSTCVNGFGWLTHRLAASQSNANCLIEMECFQLHRWVHSDLINYPPVLINCGPCDVPDSTHSSPSCTWCVHSNLPAHFSRLTSIQKMNFVEDVTDYVLFGSIIQCCWLLRPVLLVDIATRWTFGGRISFSNFRFLKQELCWKNHHLCLSVFTYWVMMIARVDLVS